MARSVSAILVLGFLAVAAFSTGGAAADSKGALVSAKVKVSLSNNCKNNLQLVVGVGVGNVLYCQKGSLAVLGPLVVKVEALNLLYVQLFVVDKNGKLRKDLKIVVKIDLSLLGQLVDGVVDLVLDVVEEIVVGVEGKVIKLFCGKLLLGQVVVKLKL